MFFTQTIEAEVMRVVGVAFCKAGRPVCGGFNGKDESNGRFTNSTGCRLSFKHVMTVGICCEHVFLRYQDEISFSSSLSELPWQDILRRERIL